MREEIVLLDQLKLGNKCAFDLIYKSYYPMVERFIFANTGSREDAQDIFQETLIVFSDNLSKEDFKLTSSLKTYLYSISKNLWLKFLRDNRKVCLIKIEETDIIDAWDNSPEEHEMNDKMQSGIEKMLSKLPYHCLRIIDYVYYKNGPAENMAAELGYSNSHAASNAKYKCIQKIKSIAR